jgi:hypothetical protein
MKQMTAYRFQASRVKGTRNPEGGIRVSRPSIFGNPFATGTRAERVVQFAEWLRNGPDTDTARRRILNNLGKLKNRPLGCFCPLNESCHADVLIEEANK